MDMTAEARMARAVKIVREQRDRDAVNPERNPPDVIEPVARHELERLQRAVMGEEAEDEVEILESDLRIGYYESEVQKRSRDRGVTPPIGVTILHVPSGIETRQSNMGSRLANKNDALRKLRNDLRDQG